MQTNTHPDPKDNDELREAVLAELWALYGVSNNGEYYTYEERDQYDKAADKILALISTHVVRALEDENESIAIVMRNEIEDEPDHCYNCETHNNRCYACRKKKMYKEFAKDFLRVLEDRLTRLKSQRKGEE